MFMFVSGSTFLLPPANAPQLAMLSSGKATTTRTRILSPREAPARRVVTAPGAGATASGPRRALRTSSAGRGTARQTARGRRRPPRCCQGRGGSRGPAASCSTDSPNERGPSALRAAAAPGARVRPATPSRLPLGAAAARRSHPAAGRPALRGALLPRQGRHTPPPAGRRSADERGGRRALAAGSAEATRRGLSAAAGTAPGAGARAAAGAAAGPGAARRCRPLPPLRSPAALPAWGGPSRRGSAFLEWRRASAAPRLHVRDLSAPRRARVGVVCCLCSAGLCRAFRAGPPAGPGEGRGAAPRPLPAAGARPGVPGRPQLGKGRDGTGKGWAATRCQRAPPLCLGLSSSLSVVAYL